MKSRTHANNIRKRQQSFSLKYLYLTKVTEYDNVTDHYNDTFSLKNISNIIEKNIDIIIPTIILSIPCGPSGLCLVCLMVYTLCKPLINFQFQMMEKVLYPPHPVRCIITGSSNSGNSVF